MIFTILKTAFGKFFAQEKLVIATVIFSLLITIIVLKQLDLKAANKEIKNLTQANATLVADIKVKNATITDLQKSLDVQNNSIDTYKAQADSLKKQLQEADKKNDARDKKLQEYLTNLAHSSPVPEQCQAQIEWLYLNADKLKLR